MPQWYLCAVNTPFYRDFTLGILGGGQLGRMLVQACVDLDVTVAILDYDPMGPCRYSPIFEQGHYADYEDVLRFGRACDLLTVEIEHVNVDALEVLQASGKVVYPQPHILRMVQDKGLQKLFYAEHHIPTAAFELLDSGKALKPEQLPCVLKQRTGGYDGQGVAIIRTAQDIERKAFAGPCVREALVPIREEISVLVARNPQGEVAVYPPVSMVFHPEANLVQYLVSPAPLPEAVTTQARELACTVATRLGIVGLLAVEMFWTTDGELLVNEVAPRPHNSGHHTIEASYTSQYAQHLRAILDMPLGSTVQHTPAVMLNLLGAEGHAGKPVYQGLDQAMAIPGIQVHLYGKQETRPFRKMGHITVLGSTLDEAQERARQIESLLTVTT
ncbi:MAG: 5-(carboxyamino)imidazole ribonucleotide synthase [Bacteroidetes bacterium]|nr:5-(carboxyamino)imidazole ribonucleotide synthase [Bacteroidota bacterium]